MPPAEEDDEDPDEFMEDAPEEDEEEEGDDDGEEEEDGGPPTETAKGVPRARPTNGESRVPSSSAIPMRSARGSTRTTGIAGVSCVGTPGVGGARYVALSTKTTGLSTPRQRIINVWREGGQENRLRNLFGPSNKDLRPLFDAKNRWLSQETLPSRSHKHLARSPFVTEEARQKEIKAVREWYASVGKLAFAHGQQSEEMTGEAAERYLVNQGPETLHLLAGSLKEQRICSLRKGEYMSAAAPFGTQDKRKGWVFHLGSRIQDAQWAPNETGPTQYLAVTVEQRDPAGKKYKHLANPKAPAFTKTNPFPASIQIWAFESKADGTMDPKKEPRLAHVICTDWGAPKVIRWWPVGSEDSAEQSSDGTIHLGLLASIWSDGKVRVLDVSFPQHEETQYTHYTEVALELAFYDPPPENDSSTTKERTLSALPACLCWLSPTTLAVATSSGTVAIWTLTRPDMFPPPFSPPASERPNPQPWFHRQLADTYIVTLSSGYPSRPHLLSLSTADGFARLVDLRSPFADSNCSPRGRMMVYCQAWHEHTQSFVMVDEYYMLKHSTIRRYHQAIYTFRTESTLTTVATSPVHPAVLIGTSDGTVAATNGLCRLLHSKEIPWSQVWFKHEWRRGASTTTAETAQADAPPIDPSLEDPVTFDRPLARITEGYKPVQTGIVALAGESKRPNNEGAKFITVFEEMSMASRVAWNPNLKFGTWAVAGMQSGMLRVEDLGV